MIDGPAAPRAAAVARAAPRALVASLCLVLAGILADAVAGPSSPGPAWRSLLFGGGLVLLALAARGPLRGRDRLVGALALAVAGGGLALWSDLGARRLESGWAATARSRLAGQAVRIEAEFAGFLSRLAQPARALAAQPFSGAYATDPEPSPALFDLIEQLRAGAGLDPRRLGADLVDALGRSVAWAGRTSILPAATLHEIGNREAVVVARDSLAGARLLHLSRVGDSGNVLVAEYRVRDRAGLAPEFLPSLPRASGPSPIRFQDHLRPGGELEAVFAPHADRYWGGEPAEPTLILPLRAPGGGIVATVSLRSPSLAVAAAGARRRAAGWTAAALACSLAGLLALAGRVRGPARRLLAVSAALWTLRAVLARGGFPQAVLDLRVFDLDAFASRALPDLWRSPADFFLTGVALLGQAVALAAFLRDAPGAWRRRRGGAPARAASDLGPAARIAGAALLGAAGLLGFARLARHVVANSGLNLLDLRPAGLAPEVVLLQTGLLAVLLGGMLLVAAAGTPPGAGRGGAPPGRLGLPGGARLRYLVPPAAALGAVIAYPVLAGAYQDAVARFYEYDLMPRVLDHHRVQEVALVNSLAGLGREAGLPELLAQRPETDYDEVAFDCWSRSDLAQQGLNSSIELIDRSGQVLGRFSLNMPPGRRDLRSPDAPSGVEREILQSGDRITEALHASLPLVHRGRVVGVAVLHVLDSAENLPFLSSSDPYTQFFRRPGPPEETAAGTPVLYQYDPDGAPRGGGTAPQVPTLGGLERPGEWRRVASPSGEPMDLLFARGPDGLYALGHAAPDPLAWIGGLIRLVLLYVCIAVAAGLGAGLVGGLLRPSSLRLWALAESLGRSYYRKLFATFVAAALVPLLALAVFLQGFVAREIRQERVVKGSQALDAASRILTRVSAEAVETPIDDRVIDLIHNMVGRDLHLYVEDRLIATSRRELVTAGLLPAMLDGPTYRSVYLEGRLLSESPAVEAGAEVTLLASPVSLGGLGTRAVLGLHVLTRPGDVEAQVSKVSEAILIATALLVLLLAGTGYLGARLISSPILGMVSATRRLARGELDTRVQARTRDETASLARSFNEMAGALKEREGRLRSSLLYIQKILDNATTGVVSLDARGGVVTINPAAERLLAGGGALARGDDLGRFLAGCAALRELDLAYARARGSPESEGAAEVEVRGEKAGGARRLRAVFVPFPLEAGATGQIVLLEDVTDMVRSNRLSAWAEMARQIAHDVKNPLTPIQLAVGHLRRMHRRRARSERPEEATFAATLEECLDIILEQVRQLRWIATEFSSFARIPEIHREPTDPAELIASVLRPYADAPPERVRVEQRVEPGLPRVPLDPDLMRRTLVNLVENSLQAMPDGGRLSVSAGCTRRNGASYLEIAVSDTGVGVDPKSLERLFEPYFTTKGTGTGLGLAIARRAVEEHGGEIRAESQVGRGTTFRIWIPLGPDPPATEEPPG